MRTRFVCSVGNKAVVKALFKFNDDDLTFCNAMEVASEEDAAEVAKETVHRSKVATSTQINKLYQKEALLVQKGTRKSRHWFPEEMCPQCGKSGCSARNCQFISAKCQFCQKNGHIKMLCLQKKKKGKNLVGYIIKEESIQIVNSIPCHDPAKQDLQLNEKTLIF